MFKTKLLILSLISLFFLSCTAHKTQSDNVKYSIGYIGGEYDGLILKNYLKNYLLSLNLYDEKSNFKIMSSISHSTKVYITNIDNTSDRTKVVSNLNVLIKDKMNNCSVDEFSKNISQFYILADSSKYISNKSALEKMKSENTENLVKSFINNLNYKKNNCSKTNIFRSKLQSIRNE